MAYKVLSKILQISTLMAIFEYFNKIFIIAINEMSWSVVFSMVIGVILTPLLIKVVFIDLE